MLDANVAHNKTQMSGQAAYPCGMDDAKKLMAVATQRLVGEGRRFASARELAQRAHTLGYVENAENFSRTVARVIKGDHDPQMGTIMVIARTAGVELSDFLSGDAQEGSAVNSPNMEAEEPLPLESMRELRATLLAESLMQLTSEMREIVDLLVSIDRSKKGKLRERAIENVRNMLQALSVGTSATAHKDSKKSM
jgi:hypothetical protein